MDFAKKSMRALRRPKHMLIFRLYCFLGSYNKPQKSNTFLFCNLLAINCLKRWYAPLKKEQYPLALLPPLRCTSIAK